MTRPSHVIIKMSNVMIQLFTDPTKNKTKWQASTTQSKKKKILSIQYIGCELVTKKKKLVDHCTLVIVKYNGQIGSLSICVCVYVVVYEQMI